MVPRLRGLVPVVGWKARVDRRDLAGRPARDEGTAHPPLNVPFVTFTEVTVRNTDLVCGTRKISGARIPVVADQAPALRR
ncbi:hypothetical protein [Lentzea jiangxiensis]|uniref:hypothetical protein n=1 Tax=Lentzea jiangxiensis TaxID=641025 RepID=UPI00115FD67E|nr:hypothetical protein [Lentzea jiangxiensis]